jgi:hypothetical protein
MLQQFSLHVTDHTNANHPYNVQQHTIVAILYFPENRQYQNK